MKPHKGEKMLFSVIRTVLWFAVYYAFGVMVEKILKKLWRTVRKPRLV